MVKLYSVQNNFRVQKVLIAAKVANVNVEVVNKPPPTNRFLFGQTPALEDGDLSLTGADAIAKHLAGFNTPYNPQNAEIDQWIIWAESQLLPNVLSYVLPSVSAICVDDSALESAKQELLAQLRIFNQVLLKKTFLVGERLSIADVSVALNLLPAYQNVLDQEARAELVNVNRWFQTVVNQPIVNGVVGEVKFISQVSTFNEEIYKKNLAEAVKTTASKKKTSKEKTPSISKASKKGNKEDEAEEDDLADQIAAAEPKFVDPFVQFPPGTFNLDGFKRVYSNEDTATKAIPYFWENFDSDKWSIWYSEYKFPEELTLSFMSCNLISGMFQRLEKLKKNAFASVCLFGTNNNSTISGVWIWRGDKLAFELSSDWTVDYESYDWKKLDANSEETKKLVNEYFLWEGDFGGKKFNQGKIFK